MRKANTMSITTSKHHSGLMRWKTVEVEKKER